ncbi:MAG: cell division ATP-binding protein FtsE [Candidatus Andersenbacteria bacterium RIFCSPHIGHO2_02_FULL_45_11]|uniref:Cell division ATP-binding protein FtsE n=1 Tax=Candidatus Andersenbacteria bacterium RIFCSPHIGHO2_12_FULL_45_11 TaxID=1797281 RepID=A0A1G1X239_9BACT|nr:MAG: cell division ATP-binding protein FtsE [Candidatus Andersenbacteria bacterium RIFCSPHIGHO2_01_FULL_46_36]OGY32758.1 MAG: cell division ATP-binding protein FtsE [Candidatus Andersenbacteria bacterium RIFCSPHIGHO2_02_FULL_45_11]OGY34069.1 MAG: cell division ATP-binding protein FtsE [Candidatus Andersenbacteria bacterium RIFCSPHIGHO2_12_FULL_45_11]
MITFTKVSKQYVDQTPALHGVSLKIPTGDFVSIVGQSGAGKSTLLKLLSAEEKPTQGNIVIDGWDITKIKNWQVPYLRRQIGVVFQDFKLLPKRTAFENVAFAMEVGGALPKDIRKAVPQILKLVNLLDKSDTYPNEMSGGERQRISIARALAYKPQILLADEPTGNLDALNSWDIVQLLMKINKLGTTVLLATHNDDIVNALKKRVVTLNQGKVVSDQEAGTYKL